MRGVSDQAKCGWYRFLEPQCFILTALVNAKGIFIMTMVVLDDPNQEFCFMLIIRHFYFFFYHLSELERLVISVMVLPRCGVINVLIRVSEEEKKKFFVGERATWQGLD